MSRFRRVDARWSRRSARTQGWLARTVSPRTVTVSALLLLLAACGWLVEPDLSSVAGTYELELMDGTVLPVKVGSGDCPLEVYHGQLGLTSRVGSRNPLYNVGAFLRFSCDPARIPPQDEFVRDFGKWTLRGDRVEFRSEEGRGVYLVPVESTGATGAPGPALTLLLDGHRFAFRRVRLH
jgi:hypothetical protein